MGCFEAITGLKVLSTVNYFCVKEFQRMESLIVVQRLFKFPSGVEYPRETSFLNRLLSLTRQELYEMHTSENVERVGQAATENPTRSSRRQAAALNISKQNLGRILHYLKFHPYKIQIYHQIYSIEWCTQLIRLLDNDPKILNNLLMSYEAYFYLSGYIYKQNHQYWSNEQPEEPQWSSGVIWTANEILGPYVFEENLRTITVTSRRYLYLIQNFFTCWAPTSGKRK